MPNKRIAIYGGTFDPIHRGHLAPLRSIVEEMGWDRVILVPAFVQPFKVGQQISSRFHRFAMAVLATVRDPRFEVSPIELETEDVSYSIDTLRTLAGQNPEASLEWVIGDDNLERLLRWREIESIFELANFVVLNRNNAVVPRSLSDRVVDSEGRPPSGRIVMAGNKRVDASGTEIRRRVAAGEAVRDLVGEEIAEYIERYRLYHPEEKL